MRKRILWKKWLLLAASAVGSAGLGAAGLAPPRASTAGEIGYVEEFALATDRSVALKQLIPGTEDYYYYHALHHLNTQQYDQVRTVLKAWLERSKNPNLPRYVEIETRLALLTYPQSPQATLDYLRRRLGVQFNHAKEQLDAVPNFPTKLDPALISREKLLARAFAQTGDTSGVEDAGLEWLLAEKLTPERLRHLLQRLTRPDYAALPALVVEDLNRPNSPGFGAFPIHRQLLLAQLDECLKLKPDLLNQGAFVQAYLTKLQPGPDDDWRHDPAVRDAYLGRLAAFTERLAPVHNSLKAHVRYHRLASDRAQGKYDRARLLAYLQLPRPLPYVARKHLELDESRRFPVDLNADFAALTLLPPVANDEPLVRDCLARQLIDAADASEFAPYVDDVYLKHLFAETKIVNGLGEPEQWAAQLPPELFRQLRERVDIDFAPTNPALLDSEAPVRLEVQLKNVPTLIVKVFEINARNYYRQHGREIDTDVNLDGLVANDEKTYTYQDSPFRRTARKFEFPQLKGPGVYVIDLIGNGRSSRVLIRKGKLRPLVRTTAAGQQVTVLDERNRVQKDAVAWVAGQEYAANKDGLISIPFSSAPGRRPIVLSRGDFASLEYLQQEGEEYALEAGLHVDRESLLVRKKAQLALRPLLKLNGVPTSIDLLEQAVLRVLATDQEGVTSLQEIPGVRLFEDRETTHEFQTPGRLASIEFILQGKVKSLRDGKLVDVSARQRFSVNGIDQTDKIEELHLAMFGDEYAIELRGRTGELRPNRAVHLAIKHRDFPLAIDTTLKTDEQGRISLGRLDSIQSIAAQGPDGVRRTWTLAGDRHRYGASLHGAAGDVLTLPYLGAAAEPRRDELSLLSVNGETFVADHFQALAIRDGLLEIKGLPPGDYLLRLKREATDVRVRVVAGAKHDDYVLGALRQLETSPLKPLQIVALTADGENVRVRLTNLSKFARVHVYAGRYLPAFDPFTGLGAVRGVEPYVFTAGRAESTYVTGRNIGDEYRYILDRKYAQKFPGNMLERPSLLLNPWAVRSTVTEVQTAQGGEDFGAAGAAPPSSMARGGDGKAAAGGLADYSNLDFLFDGAAVVLNLTPDKDGVVTVPRKALGARQHVHVVAVDPLHTTYRTLALPEQEQPVRDLRLIDGLDPKQHFTQQKRISVVPAGRPLVINDVSASRFETYDSLGRLYSLYAALNQDPQWGEFRFLTEWNGLKPERKRELYSKYAGHELNFFLLKKDPEFFQQVVKPYLSNKKDKTFLDRWLLDEPLDDFLRPWNHGRLNLFERVLLGRKIPAERPRAARHAADLVELLPPDVDRFIRLFDTAVKAGALEPSSAAVEELKLAKERLEERQNRLFDAPKPAAAAPGAPGAPPVAARAPAAEPEFEKKQMEQLEKRASMAQRKSTEAETFRRSLGANRDGAAKGERLAAATGDANGAADKFFGRYGREDARRLFRQLDPTMEWAENNYYHLTIDRQNASLIGPNRYWSDLAAREGDAPFQSMHSAEASNNLTEMLIALALTDLPFQAGKHDVKLDGLKLTITPAGPMIVYHEEILPAPAAAAGTPILVSQNFFRHGDRQRTENGEQVDKYVADEFLVHAVYGCQVVVTNPTSARQKLNVLTQIPVGAVPVLKSQATKTVFLTLEPYHTQTIEYYFYFPTAGDYAHFPVHVAKNEQLVASAAPFVFHVVEKPTKIDARSWDYVSQHGTNDEVLEFLRKHNVHGLNLDRIAFRMRDAAFFQTAVQLLTERHAYNPTLWSYGIAHNHAAAVREFLEHSDAFVQQCGGRLESPLLVVDPVRRGAYEHLEYKPLVNARAHALGRRRQIVNDRFHDQYHRFLTQLAYQRSLTDDDWLAATYYLLLQDRVGEALAAFERVKSENVATKMQYDYCAAYLNFYREEFAAARRIAESYVQHPVDRWRNTFAAIVAQLDEAAGGATKTVDVEDRTQQQTGLAAAAPSFDLQVEARKLTVNYQNLKTVRVNYYLMDVELLFSRNPFVQQVGDEFSAIRPNLTQELTLPEKQTTFQTPLPESLANRNVVVEVTGGGQTKRLPYFSNGLAVQVVENYGQVRVAKAADGKPVPKAYVKVYARSADGQVKFYKDGYTDVRGRFDYASLSTNDLTTAKRFAVLVLSDELGALVREAGPPAR